MKKILITGKNSYIGISLEAWLKREPDKYMVDSIDLIAGSWEKEDFSKYDVVFHVAGIVHIKEKKSNQNLYNKVNRDLAFETVKKAKEEGVKQFIFLSSMSVYGVENGVISKSTPTLANTPYGKSKLEGEKLIQELSDDGFIVSVLRPPMVYGKGCKGNYPRLAKLSQKLPIFPKVNNKRSMIYIDNLSEFVKNIIDKSIDGVFFPQNEEFVNTSEMVSLIAKAHGKNIKMTKFFNPLLKIFNVGIVNKVFGDLVYEKDMSEHEFEYRVCDFGTSILNSEKG